MNNTQQLSVKQLHGLLNDPVDAACQQIYNFVQHELQYSAGQSALSDEFWHEFYKILLDRIFGEGAPGMASYKDGGWLQLCAGYSTVPVPPSVRGNGRGDIAAYHLCRFLGVHGNENNGSLFELIFRSGQIHNAQFWYPIEFLPQPLMNALNEFGSMTLNLNRSTQVLHTHHRRQQEQQLQFLRYLTCAEQEHDLPNRLRLSVSEYFLLAFFRYPVSRTRQDAQSFAGRGARGGIGVQGPGGLRGRAEARGSMNRGAGVSGVLGGSNYMREGLVDHRTVWTHTAVSLARRNCYLKLLLQYLHHFLPHATSELENLRNLGLSSSMGGTFGYGGSGTLEFIRHLISRFWLHQNYRIIAGPDFDGRILTNSRDMKQKGRSTDWRAQRERMRRLQQMQLPPQMRHPYVIPTSDQLNALLAVLSYLLSDPGLRAVTNGEVSSTSQVGGGGGGFGSDIGGGSGGFSNRGQENARRTLGFLRDLHVPLFDFFACAFSKGGCTLQEGGNFIQIVDLWLVLLQPWNAGSSSIALGSVGAGRRRGAPDMSAGRSRRGSSISSVSSAAGSLFSPFSGSGTLGGSGNSMGRGRGKPIPPPPRATYSKDWMGYVVNHYHFYVGLFPRFLKKALDFDLGSQEKGHFDLLCRVLELFHPRNVENNMLDPTTLLGLERASAELLGGKNLRMQREMRERGADELWHDIRVCSNYLGRRHHADDRRLGRSSGGGMGVGLTERQRKELEYHVTYMEESTVLQLFPLDHSMDRDFDEENSSQYGNDLNYRYNESNDYQNRSHLGPSGAETGGGLTGPGDLTMPLHSLRTWPTYSHNADAILGEAKELYSGVQRTARELLQKMRKAHEKFIRFSETHVATDSGSGIGSSVASSTFLYGFKQSAARVADTLSAGSARRERRYKHAISRLSAVFGIDLNAFKKENPLPSSLTSDGSRSGQFLSGQVAMIAQSPLSWGSSLRERGGGKSFLPGFENEMATYMSQEGIAAVREGRARCYNHQIQYVGHPLLRPACSWEFKPLLPWVVLLSVALDNFVKSALGLPLDEDTKVYGLTLGFGTGVSADPALSAVENSISRAEQQCEKIEKEYKRRQAVFKNGVNKKRDGTDVDPEKIRLLQRASLLEGAMLRGEREVVSLLLGKGFSLMPGRQARTRMLVNLRPLLDYRNYCFFFTISVFLWMLYSFGNFCSSALGFYDDVPRTRPSLADRNPSTGRIEM
eukprot:g5064.t1